MAQIDPTSLALLSVLAATAAVIAIHFVIAVIRHRLEVRRWRVSEDVSVDLTFVRSAIERDRESARRNISPSS